MNTLLMIYSTGNGNDNGDPDESTNDGNNEGDPDMPQSGGGTGSGGGSTAAPDITGEVYDGVSVSTYAIGGLVILLIAVAVWRLVKR